MLDNSVVSQSLLDLPAGSAPEACIEPSCRLRRVGQGSLVCDVRALLSGRSRYTQRLRRGHLPGPLSGMEFSKPHKRPTLRTMRSSKS